MFIAVFVFVLLLSIKRKEDPELFSRALTQELKGLAILSVIFAHIGYFLSNDHSFLFPLSIISGVGVNLFLFLSGFGLTVSELKEKLPLGEFYKKRLLKLFVPFWIVIIAFFLLDFFLLHISYSSLYIAQSLVGFFPRADLFIDINSPLWFFTPILFYYLVFPFFFYKKNPLLTAGLIYISSYFIIQLKLPVTENVLHLYQLHLLAFPLGVAFASLLFKPNYFNTIKISKIFPQSLNVIKSIAYYLTLIALLILIGYTAYYSGVGENPWKEQLISLVTMGAIILFFIMKKFEIKVFHIFGIYAYEIYLIHWPLVSRYDLFFKLFPAWLAMVFNLALLLVLAWVLVKIQNQIRRIKIPHRIHNVDGEI